AIIRQILKARADKKQREHWARVIGNMDEEKLEMLRDSDNVARVRLMNKFRQKDRGGIMDLTTKEAAVNVSKAKQIISKLLKSSAFNHPLMTHEAFPVASSAIGSLALFSAAEHYEK